MKRYFLATLLAAWALLLGAQVPAGYYSAAQGKCGQALKTALYGCIKDHTKQSYDYLWTAFKKTDVRADGKIWDMYSNATDYEPGGPAQGHNYSGEGDSYNREHSFPKSWANNMDTMMTDLHHLVPTDGYVNNRRSNYPFGETNGETYKSANGFSKLGACTTAGYTGTVFEPNDEYKGDFARIYFYIVTRYENRVASWSGDMLGGSRFPAFSTWARNMLLRWAKEDPVSQKEIDRNNKIDSIQHNRNPFVDYEGLEQYIWGDLASTPVDLYNYVPPYGGSGGSTTIVAAPVLSPGGGEIAPGESVTITCGTAGATIYYSTDEGETWGAGTSPVSVEVGSEEGSITIVTYATAGSGISERIVAAYTITGEATQPTDRTGIYEPVTSADQLVAGKRYLIVCPSKKLAAGPLVASKPYFESVSLVLTAEGNADATATPTVQPFVLGGKSGAWTFALEGTESYLSWESGNSLGASAATGDASTQWLITTSSDATELQSAKDTRRTVRYNASSPRFACYTSGQTAVQLYVERRGDDLTAIDAVVPGDPSCYSDGNSPVYDLQGRRVTNPKHGVYIRGGKKIFIR